MDPKEMAECKRLVAEDFVQQPKRIFRMLDHPNCDLRPRRSLDLFQHREQIVDCFRRHEEVDLRERDRVTTGGLNCQRNPSHSVHFNHFTCGGMYFLSLSECSRSTRFSSLIRSRTRLLSWLLSLSQGSCRLG